MQYLVDVDFKVGWHCSSWCLAPHFLKLEYRLLNTKQQRTTKGVSLELLVVSYLN